MAEAIDGKDSIEISIDDRTIRTLLGITVNELVEEVYWCCLYGSLLNFLTLQYNKIYISLDIGLHK